MDGLHLHLALNHLPIIGSLVGFFLLVVGFIIKSGQIKNSAYFLFMGCGLVVIAATITGEYAEDKLKELGNYSMALISDHEEIAKLAMWSMLSLAVLSTITLFLHLKKHKLHRIFSILVLAFSLISLGFFYQAGKSGGIIKHDEIRTPADSARALEYVENEDD